MNKIYKPLLRKLIFILCNKLAILTKLLVSDQEKGSEIYQELSQLNEILSWCLELTQNYKSADLALFCEMAEQIRSGAILEAKNNKIDQERAAYLFKIMNDPAQYSELRG